MKGHDAPSDDLDELIDRFAAGGYAPDGAEVDEGHSGHEHEHGGGHGHGAAGQVRTFSHRGHSVEIATHYAVTIDGEPWDQPLEVGHDGTVSYHGLPQYIVPSAVDLVRSVIDNSYEAPEEVRSAVRDAREAGG